MSKIEIYKKLKRESDECRDIVRRSRFDGNQNHMHWAKSEEYYHLVSFSFCSKTDSSHQYEVSAALAEALGEACKEMKEKIFDRAVELAEIKTAKALSDSREEALKIIEETKGQQ